MKQTIKLISETEAQVTKSFKKQAMIFGTPEYKLWREFLRDFPQAKMVTKSIKKNSNKKTYKNMTYANMRTYISCQENAEVELKEFERQIQLSKIKPSPYKYVLNWFINKYEESDQEIYNYNTSNTELAIA